jgi:hypothetical protein
MLRILNKIWIKKYKDTGIINFTQAINTGRFRPRKKDSRIKVQTEVQGKPSTAMAVRPKEVTSTMVPKHQTKIIIEYAGNQYDVDEPNDVEELQAIASSPEGRAKHQEFTEQQRKLAEEQELKIVELMDELKELGSKKRTRAQDEQIHDVADALSGWGNVENLNLNDEEHTTGDEVDERIKEIRIELKELNYKSPLIRAYATGRFQPNVAQQRAQQDADRYSKKIRDTKKALDSLLDELGVESDTIIKEDTGIILEELNKKDKRLIKTLLQLANPTEYFNEDVLKLGELITAMKSLGVVNKNKNLKKQILKYEDENLKVVKRAVRLRREYEKLYKSIREVIYPKSGDEDE